MKINDYGCDPVGDGTYRMVPSGDIVNQAERDLRLKAIHDRPRMANDCLGKSWAWIEAKQGCRAGTLTKGADRAGGES